MEDIEKDTAKVLQFVRKHERPFSSTKHSFSKGQVLYSKLRPYLNKVVVAPEDGYCTSEILPLSFNIEICSEYVRLFLMSDFFLAYANQCSYGVKMPRLGTTDGKKALFALPPLQEQKRIAYTATRAIETIEIIDNEGESLLDSVASMKSKILSLAICGKLVPQDPNDEPASVLLERIRTEREALIKAGKIKRNKNETTITRSSDNSYYEKIPVRVIGSNRQLPDGWMWARLADVANIVMGQSPSGDSVSDSATGTEFHQGKIYFTDRYLIHSKQYASAGNKITDKDSVLLCVRAPVGIVNITKRKIAIGRGLCALSPLGGISVEFLFHWLTAFQSDFISQATGTTFMAITTEVVRQQLIPIPPIAEQHRIVATIENSLTYLNEITKNIN